MSPQCRLQAECRDSLPISQSVIEAQRMGQVCPTSYPPGWLY